jgi:predicted RNA-binding protein YlqC (UPF0109 family)
MKALVEYIAGAIVSNPDEVQVTEDWEGERVYVRLTVASDDKGKVIGRDGRVAQSIRSLLRVAAVKQDVHTVLEIE